MKRSAADKSRNRRRFIRRGLITVCAVSCLTLVTGCAYRWMASRALEKEVASAERDANTGVLVGAEPLVLGTGERGVLLLHGFIGSPMDFGELPQRLADAGYRVRAPLLPGHGTRPQDMLETDAAAWLEAARRAYRELAAECDWVAIAGFSMGGTLAIRLAADDGERLPDALVLACPFLGVTYRWYAALPPATWNNAASMPARGPIPPRRSGTTSKPVSLYGSSSLATRKTSAIPAACISSARYRIIVAPGAFSRSPLRAQSILRASPPARMTPMIPSDILDSPFT